MYKKTPDSGCHQGLWSGEFRVMLIERRPRFDPHSLQDLGHGAKSGKGRLKQIGTHKRREKEPIGAVQLGKKHTEQNKPAGNRHNDSIDSHNPPPLIGPATVFICSERQWAIRLQN
jgi:hypothetical protein